VRRETIKILSAFPSIIPPSLPPSFPPFPPSLHAWNSDKCFLPLSR
jgi:hypothetical protein